MATFPLGRATGASLLVLLLLIGSALLGRRPLAESFVERGLEARSGWRMETAERRFRAAIRIDPRLADARLELTALLQLQGRMAEAAEPLQSLLARDPSELEPRARVRVLLARGLDHRRSAEPEAAISTFRRAAETARDLELEDLEIRADLATAEMLYADDRTDAARPLLDRALEQSRRLGERGLEADALVSHGILQRYYSGHRRGTVETYFEPAREIYSELDDLNGLAWAQTLIAAERMARQDFAEADRRLQEASRLSAITGSVGGESRAQTYLGNLHARMENPEQALRCYRRGLELSEATGDRLWSPRVLGLIAHLHLRRSEFEQTLEILDRLLAESSLTLNTRRDHWITRGHALLHLGRAEPARDAYQEARALNEQKEHPDPDVQSDVHTMIAHTAIHQGDYEAAEAALTAAEAIPIADKGWASTVLHTLARADLFDYQGRRPEALSMLVAAAEIESRTFGTAPSHFFQTQYWQVFNRLFSLLFEGVLPTDDAQAMVFRLVEQMRFRSFRSLVVDLHGRQSPETAGTTPERAAVLRRIEELGKRYDQSPELREALRLAYLDYEAQTLSTALSQADLIRLQTAEPIKPDDFRRSLPKDTALVQFILAGDRPFALIVRHDRLESVPLEISNENLESRVKLLRKLLFDGPLDDRWRRPSRALYESLIQPMTDRGFLNGAKHLVLIPMGPLHELPFAALLDLDGTFLIERFTLKRALSASHWARSSPAPTADRRAVAFGLRKARDGSRELPHAELEAETVAARFGESPWIGERATEAALHRAASAAAYLHIATHGRLERRLPLHSHLELLPGGEHDGRLTVREILELSLTASLVTLSACDTAVSPGRTRGLEVDRLGFVEAFLHAGASNVLAGLQKVPDRSSAELMSLFYQRLEPGSSTPAEALAEAQRTLLNRPGGSGHPKTWAPFALTGRRAGAPSPDHQGSGNLPAIND